MRFLVLLMILGFVLVGCASSGSNKRVHDGPTTPIGEAPQGDDAEFAPPPPGPDLIAQRGTRQASPVQDDGEEGLIISRSQLEVFLSKGPSFLFSQVDTEPFHEGGKFVGFQLADVTLAAHEYIAPHLRVGDVVTHINGVRLQRPDDYLQVWNGLGEATSVRVDFRRDDEPNHVIWRIR